MGDTATLLSVKSGVNPSQIGPTRDNGLLPIICLKYLFQRQQLGGPVLKSEEDTSEVGGGGKGVGEGERNCAGMGNNVQGSGTDSAALRERELVSDRYDSEGAVGVSP